MARADESLSSAERLAARTLRLAVGFSLITDGVLKLWAPGGNGSNGANN